MHPRHDDGRVPVTLHSVVEVQEVIDAHRIRMEEGWKREHAVMARPEQAEAFEACGIRVVTSRLLPDDGTAYVVSRAAWPVSHPDNP